LKKNDPNKVTGKDLLSSMSQFKEVYMQDYFRHSNTNFEDNPIESVDKSYLEVRGHFFLHIQIFLSLIIFICFLEKTFTSTANKH
jgi:hypothetical protein